MATKNRVDTVISVSENVLLGIRKALEIIERLAAGAAAGGTVGAVGATIAQIAPLAKAGLSAIAGGIDILQAIRGGSTDYDNLTPDQIMARVAPTLSEIEAQARKNLGMPPA